ncbi:septation protein SepH [Aestuariimicrobium sp. p3-SID1156]|uniref:septation protein SepH n=1 Tax=Aestuariimicrobium sp. p3-SID1156 TaxID=2916038 RepID=UPI00223BCAB7|nr:septation protein SepH [Aestuariimicrobium sp. p3-SID1156]MCT1459042.1 septation protein SepH [Aestuariimicrobium sp. p3-SID1156]
MDNTLSPREIQARIRAGESVEDLVSDSGMSYEAVEPFAAPVLAEREHVVGQALSSPIRKKGESSSARSLRQVVREHLQHRGIDIDDVQWDSWREPDRRWGVVARFCDDETNTDSPDVEARFIFDTRGRFSTASDDAARSLIGEPLPGAATPADPDSEPTVELDDDMALVRATQKGEDAGSGHDEPSERGAVDFATAAPDSPPATTVDEAHDDLIGHESQLDVLYDMLSAFDEDSVNIYADLDMPVIEELADETSGQAEELPAREVPEEEAKEPVEEQLPAQPVHQPQEAAPDEPAITEPEQDPLVEAPTPKPRPRARKGRASVPSWDEIMFGGPRSTT